MSKSSAPESEFYEAVGRAITQWGIVESALADLFQRIVLCALSGKGMLTQDGAMIFNFDGRRMVDTIGHASTNFRGRLDLIDHMLNQIVRDDQILAEWSAIKNKAGRLYSRRNVLAHGVAFGRDGVLDLVTYIGGMNRTVMDYQRICAATPSFARYAERIRSLAIAVNQHLAAR